MCYNGKKFWGGLKMRTVRRITCVILTVMLLLISLSSCRGAVCISELTIADASGKGERVCYIYSPATNTAYIEAGQKHADWLNGYLAAALGESAASSYLITYEGRVASKDVEHVNMLYEMPPAERELGYDVFKLRYSFINIKDYNRKTSLLYNLSKKMAEANTDDTYRVGMLDDYVDTILRITELTDHTGIPTGECTVTLTETGAVSYGIVAWAFIALYQNRMDESLWKTDEIYFAPFSDNETHTVFSALKTQLTVTVGETVRTVTPITGPVIEGQGQVEGIVFNVTGTLPSIADPSLPLWLILTICFGGIFLVFCLIAVMLSILKKRRVG